MMASTCCFMVPAGATFLPFGLSAHVLSSFFFVCLVYSPFFPPTFFFKSVTHIFISVVQQPTLPVLLFNSSSSTSLFNSFFLPSTTHSSFLCGSLPWCTFYGQQPWAAHLSKSGLMCSRRVWMDVEVKAHKVPKQPNIRIICHTAALWPRPFNLARLWLCIFILRVVPTWRRCFILQNRKQKKQALSQDQLLLPYK